MTSADDQQILQISKELTFNFLNKIDAKIEETEGLYNVKIPKKFEGVFGANKKRITFSHDVADTHSCELVVPGSNFLATVINEIKKQAPLIGGSIKRQIERPTLKSIQTHNCNVILVDSQEEIKTAVRFYFNINVKNIQHVAMLRQVDVDLESLNILELPFNIHLDDITSNIIEYQKDRQQIDNSYSKATEFLSLETQPLAQKYVELGADNLNNEINSINQAFERRVIDINSDLRLQRNKLAQMNTKIARARTYQSRENHIQQKRKQELRVKKDEEKTAKQIVRLASDRDEQIEQAEKRYRPIVECALIAAQIYSYSSSKCNLEFKNDKLLHMQVKADFVDPAKSFIVICNVCKDTLDVAHLCVNSHISCSRCSMHCIKCQKDVCISCKDEMMRVCYICRELLCSECIIKCHFCSEVTCMTHLSTCSHCSNNTCYFCSDNCQVCHTRVCQDSIQICNACKNVRLCEKDAFQCVECRLLFCPDDINTCAICNKKHCHADTAKCELCEQTYSKGCLDQRLCTTCKTLSPLDKESSEVRSVILADQSLSKFKKWSGSTNTRFSIFKVKKMFGGRIITYDKIKDKILVNKKAGWL